MKPEKVNILGITYKIEYVDNPAEVDLFKRQALWGQIDYWTRTIRVYDKGRTIEDIFKTIIHEVLHGIGEALHLSILTTKENHDQLDTLALAMSDIMIRNKWIVLQNNNEEYQKLLDEKLPPIEVQTKMPPVKSNE